MGWTALTRVGSMGNSRDRETWSCHFMAKDHPDGAGFGVTFTTDLGFLPSHGDASYTARAPIGDHEAVVARSPDGTIVSIQVHARGIAIETNANNAGAATDVERKLAEATRLLIDTLAIDPAAALRE